MDLFQKHLSTLNKVIDAVHKREFYAYYPEIPSAGNYGETANENGKKSFESRLNSKFAGLEQEYSQQFDGEEISPYTLQPLGIKYPIYDVESLVKYSRKAYYSWKNTSVQQRAGLLIETLDRIKEYFFEIAYATMHTTGQSFMMSFQASGPHANDRALEAIGLGYQELTRFPSEVIWDKPMGKFNVTLKKSWKIIPKGVGLVIGCSTFPTWNSLPGIYANLITGNSVIVKPHPGAVLPIAIIVSQIQNIFKENGIDPNTCILAVDTSQNLIAKKLAEHPDVRLIDYTGGSSFGEYIESLKDKIVFTEKAGVNSAIIDSTEDMNLAMQNLAFSLSLYSGQMCTAPQNIFIPETGIINNGSTVDYDTVVKTLVSSVNNLVTNPKTGHGTLGAVQSDATCKRITECLKLDAKVLSSPVNIQNPDFPSARLFSPVILEVNSDKKEVYEKELFGPISIIIKTKSTDESIHLAKEMAMKKGALSCAAYTTDPKVMEKIENEMTDAGATVSFNLTGMIWVNQHAGFSDFHVTGANPAGNASFTNPEFLLRRFSLVGVRVPVKK